MLSRYTRNVVLLFDADAAGIKASMRSIEILLKRNFDVKISTLPKDEDPWILMLINLEERLSKKLLNGQKIFLSIRLYYESQEMFDDPTKMAEAIRELVKPIALVDDELKRSLLIRNISRKFNLREKLLESELSKALEFQKKQNRIQSQRILK